MKAEVSHSWQEESMDAKFRWFLQKPLAERLKEAFQEAQFIQKLTQFELPDDRSSFKTFKILERPRG